MFTVDGLSVPEGFKEVMRYTAVGEVVGIIIDNPTTITVTNASGAQFTFGVLAFVHSN